MQDWRKVPFSGDQCWFFFRLVTGPFTGKPVRETSVIQTRSSEVQRWTGTWEIGATCYHAWLDQCVRQFSNTFCSWKRNVERWRWNTSWGKGKIRCWSWRVSRIHDGERGGHRLPNSRTSTLRCDACAEYQRSRVDSENWEPSLSTRSWTRSSSKSII